MYLQHWFGEGRSYLACGSTYASHSIHVYYIKANQAATIRRVPCVLGPLPKDGMLLTVVVNRFLSTSFHNIASHSREPYSLHTTRLT